MKCKKYKFNRNYRLGIPDIQCSKRCARVTNTSEKLRKFINELYWYNNPALAETMRISKTFKRRRRPRKPQRNKKKTKRGGVD